MPTISQIRLPSGTVYDLAGSTASGALSYKGTLGTGGTIDTLPSASANNKGYMYAVITAGTYASKSAVVDDLFWSDGTAWNIIKTHDTQYGVATTSTNGLMSSTDKSKLDGIESGAEVNQNAFGKVVITSDGSSSEIDANSKTSILSLKAHSNGNVKLTKNSSNEITIKAGTSTFGNAAYKDVTNTYSSSGTDPISGQAVAAALETLPEPMVFKGSLGTGGTITSSGTVKAKLKSETKSQLTAASRGSTVDREYPVGVDANGDLSVNVPWENSTYSMSESPQVGHFLVIGSGGTYNVPINSAVVDIDYNSSTGYFTKTDMHGSYAVESNVAKATTTTVPNVTSVGSAPTLGAAIPADDITDWHTNQPTLVSFSVSGEQLQISVTDGTAASLSYTAKSIPNVTSVGSAPTLGTAKTVVTGFEVPST